MSISHTPIWQQVLDDFSQPAALWQLGVLGCCLLIAWQVSGRLRLKLRISRENSSATLRTAAISLYRAAFPLMGAALVAVAQAILGRWFPTHVLHLALVPLCGLAVLYAVFYVLRRSLGNYGLAGLLLFAEWTVTSLVWIGMILYVTGSLPDVIDSLDAVQFGRNGKHPFSLLDVLLGFVWVMLTVLLALLTGRWLEERLMRANSLDMNLRVVLARVSQIALLLIAVLTSLSLVGIDLTVLSVFGGAFGVGLGFGLQKIASNYVSGFIILLERSLRLGDLVMVDKYFGEVTMIRTRYTIIRALDGVESVVPNELFVSQTVQNHSLTERRVRIATKVQVDYNSDVHHVLNVLVEAAQSVPRVLADPGPSAALMLFADSGIEFELGFWIEDVHKGRQGVLSAVNVAVWEALKRENISIPYPRREVTILNSSVESKG
jgi:small-conductance mechanosensitive channel